MKVRKKNINSNDLFSRNWLFINQATQDKIKNVKILCCGVGLGSYLAELLARTGFENLIIADGDVVNRANLNRQAFTHLDIKKNKCIALKKRLKQINPRIKVKIIDKYLLKKDLEILIPDADYIINTIDFDHNSFIECNLLCKKFNKIELFPTNLGFGGSVLVSTPKTPSLVDYFHETDRVRLKNKIVKHLIKESPSTVKNYFKEYFKTTVPYDPQLGISSFITAALLATTILKLVDQIDVKVFPEVISSDFESIVEAD